MNEQIIMLERVAAVLSGLEKPIVFIGGATIPLYLDDMAALEARATKDIDCVVEITSRSAYYQFSETLRQIGLQESPSEGVICRWLLGELIVDIMPVAAEVLGFANRWYLPGIHRSIPYILPSGRQILIFAIPDLLAAKIEAFENRGQGDFYGSADLEDIVSLLDGCPNVEPEVQQAELDVQVFIKGWLRNNLDRLIEIAPAHLPPSSKAAGRTPLLQSLIHRLAATLPSDLPETS